MSFQLLVNNLLSEEDCRALQKNPSETLVSGEQGQECYQNGFVE